MKYLCPFFTVRFAARLQDHAIVARPVNSAKNQPKQKDIFRLTSQIFLAQRIESSPDRKYYARGPSDMAVPLCCLLSPHSCLCLHDFVCLTPWNDLSLATSQRKQTPPPIITYWPCKSTQFRPWLFMIKHSFTRLVLTVWFSPAPVKFALYLHWMWASY